jgi:glycosyltransferase involved in cell wall biosynthesis
MLDATACGIPIVTNDRVNVAIKHVQEHGIIYKENSVEDLQRALLCLQETSIRNQLGSLGAAKISSEYSWLALAKNRLNEYELALQA